MEEEVLQVMDEIESVLKIHCAPVTWPIGMGKRFKGVLKSADEEKVEILLEDDRLEHGPLEALFTVDEEDGMGGARGLAPDSPGCRPGASLMEIVASGRRNEPSYVPATCAHAFRVSIDVPVT